VRRASRPSARRDADRPGHRLRAQPARCLSRFLEDGRLPAHKQLERGGAAQRSRRPAQLVLHRQRRRPRRQCAFVSLLASCALHPIEPWPTSATSSVSCPAGRRTAFSSSHQSIGTRRSSGAILSSSSPPTSFAVSRWTDRSSIAAVSSSLHGPVACYSPKRARCHLSPRYARCCAQLSRRRLSRASINAYF